MHRTLIALSLVVPATISVTNAQSITSGTTADVTAEASSLFRATDGGVVSSASVTAPAVLLCGGSLPEEIQWGVSRGFRNVNGFVLSTGWVDNGDEENPPTVMDFDLTGCANPNGIVGNSTTVPCSTQDTVLQAGLSTLPFTSDAVAYVVDFDLASDAEIDLAYNFATFENPTDVTFFDSFGIFVDGTLIAGGTSNGGADAAGDPWALLPSQALPASEYNSLPAFTTYVTPAHETGRRIVSLSLSAGAHTIEYRLADGSANGDASCGESTDAAVDSMLFGGLYSYHSENIGAHTPGFKAGRIGHPAVTGGPFPDDLQITATGAAPGSVLLLLQSPSDLAGFTIPLFSPREIVVGLTPYQLLGTTLATGGLDVFPPAAPAIPVGTSGRFHYQWWALTPTGFECSDGMSLQF